ncbi:MAG: bifunctional adenosylcobinamide kinase/adenosylcobinamide-phosphate guanylyltransferase [Anaerolineales bacterium]|nr:bifunctional adenosylcobinamide kinase/adenosylcobinamide-phosphate guanylyltransferase [Anaerolineales bacterium]
MGKLILILGGARSGKSSFAEQQARTLGGDQVLYVATSEAKDEEMRFRVKRHRADRPPAWTTLEAPVGAARALSQFKDRQSVILLDCMTVLVGNYLLAAAGPVDDPFGEPSADPFDPRIEQEVLDEVGALVALVRESEVTLLVVSNEVGLGLAPPYALGRAYRDLLGRANQRLASQADEVYFLVAGIPMRVK